MKNKESKSLHLSFDIDNLAVPEIHVAHDNTQAEHVKKGNVPKDVLEYFSRDKYAAEVTGIEIEDAGNGCSRCSLHIKENHQDQNGEVNNGVLFTLADFAFAVAGYQKHHTVTVLTSEMRYLAKPKGNELMAECKITRSKDKVCFGDVVIKDSTGITVASVAFTGMSMR